MIRFATAGLALLALPLLLGAAGPSVEYGGATEQRFVEACQGEGLSRATCSCVNERLQASLGYEAFHEVADRGPAAFRSGALSPHGGAAYSHGVGLGDASTGAQSRVTAALSPR